MDIFLGEKTKKNKNYNYLICEKINCNNNLNLSLISITPKIGLICLMDQNILHEVPKLITGVKYVIRTELMYK